MTQTVLIQPLLALTLLNSIKLSRQSLQPQLLLFCLKSIKKADEFTIRTEQNQSLTSRVNRSYKKQVPY